jgi:hypothetical protein
MDALLTDLTTALAVNLQVVPHLADSDIDAQRTLALWTDDCGQQFATSLYLGRNGPSFEQLSTRDDEFMGKVLFNLLNGKDHLSSIGYSD